MRLALVLLSVAACRATVPAPSSTLSNRPAEPDRSAEPATPELEIADDALDFNDGPYGCTDRGSVQAEIAGRDTWVEMLDCPEDPKDDGIGRRVAKLQYRFRDQTVRQTIARYPEDDDEATIDVTGALPAVDGSSALVVWTGDKSGSEFSVWAFDGTWRRAFVTPGGRHSRTIVDADDLVTEIELCSLADEDACAGNWDAKQLRWNGERVTVTSIP